MDFSSKPLSGTQFKIDWDSELLEAAAEGNFKQFRNAFSHGANINVKNIFGQSALILATEHSHKDIVGLIIYLHQAGIFVELDTPCNAGYTALMLATINRDKKMVELLLPHLTPKQLMATDMGGSTALMWAAEKGDADTFNTIMDYLTNNKEYLLQQLEVQDGLDFTCLMHAAAIGNIDIVSTIIHDLGLKLDLNKQNCWGQTAAHLAVEQGHIRIFEMLREAGMDLSLRDHNGKTPQDYSVKNAPELNPEPLEEAESVLAALLTKFEFSAPSAPPAEAVIFSNRPPIETKEDAVNKSEKRRSRLPDMEILHRPNKKNMLPAKSKKH